MDDCLFCKIVAKEIPSSVVATSEHFLAFLDINPVQKGHTLIVPREHSTDLLDMRPDIGEEFVRFSQAVATAVVRAVHADGFNLGLNNGRAAGQVIFHTHFHLIPRFSDDGLRTWPSQAASPEELGKLLESIGPVDF